MSKLDEFQMENCVISKNLSELFNEKSFKLISDKVDSCIKSAELILESEDFDKMGEEMQTLKNLDKTLSKHFTKLNGSHASVLNKVLKEFIKRSKIDDPFLGGEVNTENLSKIQNNLTTLTANKNYFEMALKSFNLMQNFKSNDNKTGIK